MSSISWRKPEMTDCSKFISYALRLFSCLPECFHIRYFFNYLRTKLSTYGFSVFKRRVLGAFRATMCIPAPLHGSTALSGPGPRHYRGFTITLRHTTLGRTPLDGWSAQRRDLYVTTHNTYKGQRCMPIAKFEPAIPTSERPQIHASGRAATGIGPPYAYKISGLKFCHYSVPTWQSIRTRVYGCLR
jgi:hypothetical protein